MKIISAIAVVGILAAQGNAANVHVRPRSGGDGGGAQAESRERSGRDGSTQPAAPEPAQEPSVGTRTTVRPSQHHSSWDRHPRQTVGSPAGRPHNARVSVVPSHDRHHHNRARHHRDWGRPYRYSYYHGHPWYGFYVGPRYHWARWHSDRWWWYDTSFARWSFWHNGYWWWTGPAGVTYVYVNNAYSPYYEGIVDVPPPTSIQPAPGDTALPPPDQDPTAAIEDMTASSPDGKRMIQVVGPKAEAFLYDTSGGKPVFMTYLANNVAKVRFEGDETKRPARILLDFKNIDGFALFDADGRRQGGTAAISTNASPTTPPIPAPPAPLPSR
jgi:hypothetical protein